VPRPELILKPERKVKIKVKRHTNKRECYNQCFKKSSKNMKQIAPQCIIKVSELEKEWDSKCMLRILYAISDTCKAHCWSEYGP
jgi:hypothetical protein